MKLEEKVGASRYRVIKPLNSGAFALVDLAIDNEDGTFVALKRISKVSVGDVQMKDHPLSEISIHKKLDHPNIIKLKDHYETDDEFVIVMEYGGSMDLFEYIHRNESLNDSICKSIFVQILNAVEYCHSQGVYHRDIKPENILIVNGTAKLCDFGLATTEHISRDFGYGSVSYMAPEVFGDYKAIDGYFSSSADVWALGILLFNMRFGVLPWNEASKSDFYFQSFIENLGSFKRSYNLSEEFIGLLKSVFEINPFTRCSVKKLKVLFESLGDFCKKTPQEIQKRRLSFESLNIGSRKKDISKEDLRSWAEDDSEMDFTKPLQFGDVSMLKACGLAAHVTERNQKSYLNGMY